MYGYREVFLPSIKMNWRYGFIVEINPYFKEHEPEMGYIIDSVNYNLEIKLSKHRIFKYYDNDINEESSKIKNALLIEKLLVDKDFKEYEKIFKKNAMKLLNNMTMNDIKTMSKIIL